MKCPQKNAHCPQSASIWINEQKTKVIFEKQTDVLSTAENTEGKQRE